MPKRFTRAFYAASAAAVVASSLSLSLGTASAATHAPKDTAACGTNCISVFSRQLGSGTTLNAFVPGNTGSGGKVGQKVNLHLSANFRPNGDWQPSLSGFVYQFCGFLANDFFSPTSYVCLHYPFFPVIEFNWAPFGNQSGLCAGVAKGGVNNESVTLQPCGATANTVWIGDETHSTRHIGCLIPVPHLFLPVGPNNLFLQFCPLINGGDTNFSQPLVLTLNTGTTNPTNQLMLQRELLVGGVAKGTQQFAFFIDPSGGV
jgi:hypothetical protein